MDETSGGGLGQREASKAEKTDLEKRHDSGEEDMEIEKEDKERKV